jgi:hypothetical protein
MALHYTSLGTRQALHKDLMNAILDHAFLNNGLLPRDPAAFAAVLECGKARLAAAQIEVCDTADAILAAYHEVQRILARCSQPDASRMVVSSTALFAGRCSAATKTPPGAGSGSPAIW